MASYILHEWSVREILWRDGNHVLVKDKYGWPEVTTIFQHHVISGDKESLIALQKKVEKIRAKRDRAIARFEKAAEEKASAMYDPFNKKVTDIINKYRKDHRNA